MAKAAVISIFILQMYQVTTWILTENHHQLILVLSHSSHQQCFQAGG